MELQEEINELIELQMMIQNPIFQKYFSKPMKEERDKLRTDFFSDDLKESWRKGGKQEGIQVWMDLVEQAHIDLNNKKLEASERGQ